MISLTTPSDFVLIRSLDPLLAHKVVVTYTDSKGNNYTSTDYINRFFNDKRKVSSFNRDRLARAEMMMQQGATDDAKR